MSTAGISLTNIRHVYAKTGHLAIDRVSININPGEFVALVGPSGCGKSTLLNMAAGEITPTAGTVQIGGNPVVGANKDVGYVLPNDALLPWRTARQNVEFILEARGVPKRDRRTRSNELLELLGLSRFADAYRNQLSQGMRQRVSLARTFASDPKILLMDEPFSALDSQTRLQIQRWFLQLWEDTHKTVLFVTHDLQEAALLADRIIILSAHTGRIVTDEVVPLSRPRGDLHEVLFSRIFSEFHKHTWNALRDASRHNADPGQRDNAYDEAAPDAN